VRCAELVKYAVIDDDNVHVNVSDGINNCFQYSDAIHFVDADAVDFRIERRNTVDFNDADTVHYCVDHRDTDCVKFSDADALNHRVDHRVAFEVGVSHSAFDPHAVDDDNRLKHARFCDIEHKQHTNGHTVSYALQDLDSFSDAIVDVVTDVDAIEHCVPDSIEHTLIDVNGVKFSDADALNHCVELTDTL